MLKGVPTKEYAARRHYFISRMSTEMSVEDVMQYCESKDLHPKNCMELPSRREDIKSFQSSSENRSQLSEDSDIWPENIIIRRYFLNEEERTWLRKSGQVFVS